MLSDKEKQSVRDALAILAQQRIKATERTAMFTSLMITSREESRHLDEAYEKLCELLAPNSHADLKLICPLNPAPQETPG